MATLNRVQLIGRLGKDPETRFIPSGTKVCKFSIAVSRRWRASDGELKEATDWFTVEAWGHLGEICQKYLTKGRLVYVEGRLQPDKYEDSKGETKYVMRIVLQSMQMLDRKIDETQVGEEMEPVEEPEVYE